MTGFRNRTYEQRSFLILLPLLMLAVCTWGLNQSFTPDLNDKIRAELLFSVRIICPGLFALAVALVIPTCNRCLQILTVGTVYCVCISFVPKHSSDLLLNPILCVVGAISSVFALLPFTDIEERRARAKNFFISLFFVISLPLATILSLVLILRQMDIYILYTFESSFGSGLLSIVYIPIYIILQTLGFHDLVGDLIAMRTPNVVTSSFINAILVTTLFSLPSTIFVRSLFTKKNLRLFLTLLVAVCIMTNSIGACVSLSLLLLLIFFPGSFSALLISSIICFAISYWMEIPALTSVNNLYFPDVKLSLTYISFVERQVVLEIFAVFVPALLVVVSILLRKEQVHERKGKMRSINVGYKITSDSNPELVLISFLRSLGGISNIADLEEDGNWLYIQVIDLDLVAVSNLNNLTDQKVLIDRVNKLCLCDVGDLSRFLYHRLFRLIENEFGETEYDVQTSTPFDIRPMPH